jgi:tetratricopeptide (TPR) repeat protein
MAMPKGLSVFVPAFVLLTGTAAAQPLEGSRAQCADDSVTDMVVIKACTAVIQSGQEDAEGLTRAYKNLCLAQNNRGNHDQAIADCTQAIRLDPADIDTVLFRAHAFFNKSDFDSAIEDYNRAIALGSKSAETSADAFVGRAAAWHRKGDEQRAIADIDQAVRLNPKDATAFFLRGVAYQSIGDNDRAVKDYGEAIQLAPNFALSLYRRGLLRASLGDADGGAEDIARARKINPAVGK